MSQQLTLDVSGLAVESIKVVSADSLDSAAYGHGMPELAASCCEGPPCNDNPTASTFLPEGWEWDEV